MTHTMQLVEVGDLTARASAWSTASDEIGRLAGHLDRLLDTIDDKTRALQRWHDELDARWSSARASCSRRRRSWSRSEKLAAIGQLTASIAHEVNNPIAVIQGNLDLVRDTAGRRGASRCAAS